MKRIKDRYGLATSYPLQTKTAVKVTATSSIEKSCLGAPTQRLRINEDAVVCTADDRVALRTGPSKSNAIIRYIDSGVEMWVIDGPECANNWSWWKVRVQDGTVGWMAEGGDAIDPYFLCPN